MKLDQHMNSVLTEPSLAKQKLDYGLLFILGSGI